MKLSDELKIVKSNEKKSYFTIVDKNLKVHGINNLYVLGSSIFPTAGHVNPTFTICQLSLRLGDHMKNKIS